MLNKYVDAECLKTVSIQTREFFGRLSENKFKLILHYIYAIGNDFNAEKLYESSLADRIIFFYKKNNFIVSAPYNFIKFRLNSYFRIIRHIRRRNRKVNER